MNSIKDSAPYQPEVDPIDWRRWVRRARNAVTHHWLLIVLSCVCTLALLAAYVKLFPPIYKAEAVLQAEPDTDVNRNSYYQLWNMFRRSDVKSEPELAVSSRVLRTVVVDLDLKFNDVHHTISTQIAYLWTESWPGRTYRRFKEWLFPPDAADYRPTPEELELARTIDALKEGVSVESVPNTSVAKVTVLAPTYRAATIANKLIDAYLAERTRIFAAEGDKAYETLKGEVDRAAADLAKIDADKLKFDTTNQVVLDFEKDKLLVAEWVKLKAQVSEAEGTIAGLRAGLDVVQRQLATEPPEIVQAKTYQESKVRAMLEAREFELANALLQMKERFRADSPEVEQLERALEETRSLLAREPPRVEAVQQRVVNPVYSELRQREQSLHAQLANAAAILAAKRGPLGELERRMNMYPQLVKAVTEHNRIREGLEGRYKILRDRLMMADVSRASVVTAPASVRVIDYASPPMRQSWPKMVYLVPGAVALGLFLGFGMALLAEVFSALVTRDRLHARPEFPVYAVLDLRPGTAAPDRRPGAEPPPERDSAVARLRAPA